MASKVIALAVMKPAALLLEFVLTPDVEGPSSVADLSLLSKGCLLFDRLRVCSPELSSGLPTAGLQADLHTGHCALFLKCASMHFL